MKQYLHLLKTTTGQGQAFGQTDHSVRPADQTLSKNKTSSPRWLSTLAALLMLFCSATHVQAQDCQHFENKSLKYVHLPSIDAEFELGSTQVDTEFGLPGNAQNGTFLEDFAMIYEGDIYYLRYIGSNSGWYRYDVSPNISLPENNGSESAMFSFMKDVDHDGHYCDVDCDDNDPTLYQAGLWYTDIDGDGYAVEITCGDPDDENYYATTGDIPGYVAIGDCNDNEPLAYTGATEIQGDGADNDCNLATKDITVDEPVNNPSDCGQVLAFDGSNDYVAVPYNSALNSSTFTVSVWVYVQGGQDNFRAIVSNRDTGPTKGWIIYANPDNQYALWLDNGGSFVAVNGPSVTLNTWTHITGTYDGTTATLYVDGAKFAQKAVSGYVANGEHELRIGAGQNEGSPNFYFNGLLDEVKTWNRPLTAQEVSQSTEGTHPADEATTLTAHYDFNNQNGTSTLADMAGNNDGALTNMDAATDWIDADGSTPGQLWYADEDGDGYMVEVGESCSAPGTEDYYFTDPETEYSNFIDFGDCDDTNANVNPGGTEVQSDGLDNDCNPTTPDVPANNLHFDGSNDYVSVPHNSALNSSTFTVSAWVNVQGGQGGFRAIASNRHDSPKKGWIIYANGNDKYALLVASGDNNTWVNVEGPDIVLDTWTHITATYDGTMATLYVNGVEAAQQPVSGYLTNDENELRIGAGKNESTTPDFYFNGQIDEVRIWDVSRSETEIIDYKDCELKGDEAGLVAYYQFNQGGDGVDNTTITTLTDATGNYNGTLNNFALNGISSNWVGSSQITTGTICCEKVTWYADADGDNYAVSTRSCTQPAGYVADLGTWTLGDCDDTNANVNPGATEVQDNGIDDDCNPVTSDGTADNLHFDGSNDYVSVPHNSALNSSAFTVSVWVYVQGGQGDFRAIASNRNNDPKNGWILYANGDNQYAFWVANTSGNAWDILNGPDITLDTWTHITATYDGATATLYVDGVQAAQQAISGYEANSGNELRIGAGANEGSPDFYFNGQIDEVRIWDNALGVEDIGASMNCELNGDETGLVAYYPFNQGMDGVDNSAETTLADATGNDYNGTLNNFALNGSTSNWVGGSQITPGTSCDNQNQAPVLAAIGDQSVTLGGTLAFTASATDTDGDPLTYSLDATSTGLGMTIGETSGDFSWPPVAGQTGPHEVTVTVDDATATDSETFTITVNKVSQTITFDPLSAVTYGDASFDLAATASSGLAVSYASSDETVATISGNTVTIVGAGTTMISASQAGDDTYQPAEAILQELTVNQAELTVNSDDQARTYGAANPALTVSYEGFINGEDGSVLDTAPTAGTTATETSNAGTYAITASGGSDNNYAFSYTEGTLTVSRAMLTATADDQSRTYGAANPAFTVSYDGFVNGDGEPDLDTAPAGSATATATSSVGTYPITVSGGVDTNYDFSYSEGTLTISKAPLTATADDQTITYGDALPTLTISYTGFANEEDASVLDAAPSVATTATGSGGSDAGSDVISLTGGSDDNYDLTLADGTLTINKADQVITFDAIADIDLQSTNTVNLSASSDAGLAVSFTLTQGDGTIGGNTLTVNSTGTFTVEAAQAGNTNYNPATATRTFNAFDTSKDDQTITFGALDAVTYGDAAFDLTATASSNLDVSYTSSDESVATITGSTVTIVGAGVTMITASQAGDETYNPAGPAEQVLTVNKATLTVTADAQAKTYGTTDPELTWTITSGALVGDDVVTGEPGREAGEDVGAYAITEGTLAAGGNYDITFVSADLTITRADQTITFDLIADVDVSTGTVNLSATASSGLAVTFSLVSGPAELSGSALTLTGTGTVTVAANQAGNANYLAAIEETQSFAVTDATKQNQTITFDAIGDKTFGDAAFNLSATASSELDVVFSVVGGPVTISGNVVTITGTGSATIAANQDGDADFNPAPEVTQTFTIAKADQTITIDPIADKLITDGPFDVSASTTSELELTYEVSGPASISGTTITLTGSGVVTVTVNQSGNDHYNEASESITFNVTDASKENQTITFNAIGDKTFDDGPFNLSATASSALDVVFSVVSGPVTISGSEVTITGTGSATIAANQAGDADFNSAPEVTQTFIIAKAQVTITLTDLEQEADGTAKEPTVTTDPTDLNYTITYEGSADAPTSAGTYEVVVMIDEVNYEGEQTATFTLTEVSPLGVEKITISVYPNPTTDYLIVKSQKIDEVSIYDLEGRLQLTGQTGHTFDLTGLTSGTYLLISGEQKVRIIKR